MAGMASVEVAEMGMAAEAAVGSGESSSARLPLPMNLRPRSGILMVCLLTLWFSSVS